MLPEALEQAQAHPQGGLEQTLVRVARTPPGGKPAGQPLVSLPRTVGQGGPDRPADDLCIPKIKSASKWSRWRALLLLIFDNGVAGVPVKPGVMA